VRGSGISWVKGHGTENDFVLLLDPDGHLDLSRALVQAVCDRHAGVGGDGVLRVVRSAVDRDGAAMADDAEWFMDYRNADGEASEMCGNGVRVFARYLLDAGLVSPGPLRVATRDGVKLVRFDADGGITVDMGAASLPGPADVTVGVGRRMWPATSVSVGNPHAVVFVDDVAEAGDLRSMPYVGPDGAFPDGVNVEFVSDLGGRQLAMRVYERGVGETRSCGTGACAAAAAAAGRVEGGPPLVYAVDVLGGRLTVTVRPDGHVELTGPAVLVASGELLSQWLDSVAPTACARTPGG